MSSTLSANVGRSPRPRFATLVRVRQEVSKRLDSVRGAATTVDGRDLGALLTRSARTERVTAAGLREWLAARSDERFPRRHLRDRDVATLPAIDRLVSLADDAARGDWSVFGAPVKSSDANRWTTHPVTGAQTPSTHWRSIDYMNGIAGADVKFIWELNRHQPLVRIAQGYFVTRRPELAERVVALLDEWVDANPPARGINWTSSLEIAFRAIAWCWIWSLTADSPAWTDERLSRFLVSLWHHARHIDRYDSTHHSPNTHLTGELLALLYVGLTFPELKRARRWAERGRAVLTSELDRQLLRDGMHFEQSIGYHRYTAEFYLHFTLLARAAGEPVSPAIAARVRQLVGVSWLTRRPDGTWPVIGDEDSGSTLLLGTSDAQSQSTILAVGAALFDERVWLNGVDDAGRNGAWWLLDAASWNALGTMTPEPPPLSGYLRNAKYFMGREHAGADAWYCLVDAGPHGGDRTGHAHTDVGHVEIARGNVHIVADPGCASYTTNPAQRDWCRSEQAHACLVVDGVPLAVPAGPFAWERIPLNPIVDSSDIDSGDIEPDDVDGDESDEGDESNESDEGDGGDVWWCDLLYRRQGPSTHLMHQRQVAIVRGYGVLVADWIESATPVSFAAHWPLAVADASLDGTSVRGTGFLVQWAVTRGESAEPELQQIRSSPGYGRERDAKLIRVPVHCEGKASVVTAFTEDGVAMTAKQGDYDYVQCKLRGARDWMVVMRPGAAPRLKPIDDARG